MHVRTLTSEDLTEALELWARTEHLAPVARSEIEAMLAYDAGLVLAAVADEQLVGVVLGTYDGRRGWIQRLAVDPQVRRGGVARALVTELEARLVRRGCHRVNLLVFEDNNVGRSLWEALGYRGTDRVALYHRKLDGDIQTLDGDVSAGEDAPSDGANVGC